MPGVSKCSAIQVMLLWYRRSTSVFVLLVQYPMGFCSNNNNSETFMIKDAKIVVYLQRAQDPSALLEYAVSSNMSH